jgi:anti-sigma regulatory factor (Ser/Thr protein kinase)
MEVRDTLVIPVADASQVAEARRAATTKARTLGFGETGTGKVALVVTEAAANLVKHAAGGEVLLQPILDRDVPGLDVFVLDKGPGMPSVAEALRDGFSTAGSPGTGLGAISRLADLFDIYSAPGLGTALFARLWGRPRGGAKSPASRLEVGGVSAPKPGQTSSGDAWSAELHPNRMLLLIADGLGHGPDAAAASREAVRVLRQHSAVTPEALIERAHAALRPTRGAAVGVVELDLDRRSLAFAGVGNIAATVLSSAGSRGLVSLAGTVGHTLHRIQQFTYPWPEGGLLLLHSDGVATHWALDRYPGLAARHPGLIAALLYRDFRRGRDDATVVVARERKLGDLT